MIGYISNRVDNLSMDAGFVRLTGSHRATNKTTTNKIYGSVGSNASMGFVNGVPMYMHGSNGSVYCVLVETSITVDGKTNLAKSSCENNRVTYGWSGGVTINSRRVGNHFVNNANGIIVGGDAANRSQIYIRKADNIKTALELD